METLIIYGVLLYYHHSSGSSIVATDTGSGYRQPRARLGHNRVRSWKLVSFTNPARKVCCCYISTLYEPIGDLLQLVSMCPYGEACTVIEC